MPSKTMLFRTSGGMGVWGGEGAWDERSNGSQRTSTTRHKMTAGRGSTGQKSVRFSSSTSGMPSLSVGAVKLKSTYQGWRGGGYEYETDPDDAHESKYTRYLLTSPNSVNSLNFEKLCKISTDTTPPSPPKTPAGVTTTSSAVRLVSPAVGRMIGTAT